VIFIGLTVEGKKLQKSMPTFHPFDYAKFAVCVACGRRPPWNSFGIQPSHQQATALFKYHPTAG
jgi:hypothetical protein